jgi:hypothetical protein
VTVAFTVTERADQLHHDNPSAHSTVPVQAFLAKIHITQVCQPPLPLQPRFGSLRLLAFHKPKIAVEREEICECGGQKHNTGLMFTPTVRDFYLY